MIRCDYCGAPARLVTGEVIYPRRRDLWHKKFWQCRPCDAYVGCHQGGKGEEPLGRLANADLRREKMLAHEAFDPLWRDGTHFQRRADAYAWLRGEMKMSKRECHIGKFDVEECRAVVAAVTRLKETWR